VQSESQQEVTRRLPCLGFDPSFFTPGQATEAVEEGGQPNFDKMHTPGAGKLVQRELPCGMSIRSNPCRACSSGNPVRQHSGSGRARPFRVSRWFDQVVG
jgi:hypothetical protein